MTSRNFLDIPTVSFEKAEVVVVPFSFERTTSYGQGTKRGPKAIIKASSQVELFDEELWQETYKKIKITTLKEKRPSADVSAARKKIGVVIDQVLSKRKLPIILGGEHNITSFVLPVYKKYFKNLSLLQFDAHADLRDGYLNEKYSHAAAMRRCLDLKEVNLVQIGIRSISNENNELIFWQQNQGRIKTFWAKDMAKWKMKDIIDSLHKNVYLTFDLDAFDSSLMPSTGTPEPGGLQWYQAMEILKNVSEKKKIVGADVVELAPIKGFYAPDFLAAKLVYKIIGYIAKN